MPEKLLENTIGSPFINGLEATLILFDETERIMTCFPLVNIMLASLEYKEDLLTIKLITFVCEVIVSDWLVENNDVASST